MTSSPTPGRTLITNAPSWKRNTRLDKFPRGIITLGIFRLSYYPGQLCNQGCWTCLNTPTVSLSLFYLLACCRMIPIRIGLGKTFCREEKYWKLGGHSPFAVKLLGNFQKIRTQPPRNGLLVSKQQRWRRHQNVTSKMNLFCFIYHRYYSSNLSIIGEFSSNPSYLSTDSRRRGAVRQHSLCTWMKSHSPLKNRGVNWVELTFAKTSGTVLRDKVPSNDPRNDCGTHFGASFLLVSKVIDTSVTTQTKLLYQYFNCNICISPFYKKKSGNFAKSWLWSLS